MVCIGFCAFSSYAQSSEASHDIRVKVSHSSSVKIVGSETNSVNLQVPAPTEAGQQLPVEQATEASLWLNYSNVSPASSEASKQILVKIVEGSLPAGLSLVVNANTTYNTNGNSGVGMGNVELSELNQCLVRDIQTCYTGSGINKGRQLQYSLVHKPNAYAQLQATNNEAITICYTITD